MDPASRDERLVLQDLGAEAHEHGGSALPQFRLRRQRRDERVRDDSRVAVHLGPGNGGCGPELVGGDVGEEAGDTVGDGQVVQVGVRPGGGLGAAWVAPGGAYGQTAGKVEQHVGAVEADAGDTNAAEGE